MESEKRAKRPRIGMSNREGATERYEKVEYRRNGGEEGHSSYSANAERPYYPRNNYGDGGNRSYGNERPNNYGNRQGGYSNNRQGNYGNNRRNNNYNNTPRYNQDYNRNNEVGEGFQQPYGESERPRYPKQNNRSGGYNNRGYNNRGGYNQNRQQPRRNNKVFSRPQRIEYELPEVDPNEPIRLNKFMANAGICSRREADEFIQAGEVLVNGVAVTELGTKITRNDTVTSTTVTIANQSLTSVKDSEKISNVTIFTDVGSLTLDKDAWSKITTDAGNNSVVLSLSKESDTAETGASQIYEITATVNGKEIYTEGNADGSVEVDVPYNGVAPTVYYLGPDGAEKIDSSHEDGILSWTVEHFSFYAVCAEEQEASVTTSAGKTTCYDTLEGAIAFAQDGDTVKLLKDVIVESNGTASSSGAIVIDDAITLDGNGKSINAADGFDNTNIINIVNSGEVTIKDVTINGKGQSRHCINIWSATDTSEPCNVTLENVKTTGGLTGVTAGGSTLTIQGVETNIATGSWGVAVNLDSTNSAKNPASLTVKEGTIGNIYIENNANVNGTTAEISGGNIQDVVLQNVESGVEVTITGGIFNDVKEVSKVNDKITEKIPTDMITITGGTFEENVSDYLADGLVQNADGSVGKPYTPPANPNYKITIGDMENGTVTANPTAAKAGATVTLTPVPDEGYALSTLTVTDRFGDAVRVTENSDGTYTFTMPNGQVTVTATFVETEAPVDEPFVDVAEGDWFYDAVVYAYQNELMDGVGGNRFAPNSETTRAQLVTILYRLEGQPAVSGDLPFTDVETGTWYTDAILWAAQNNIVNGVSDTEFAPGDDLTRQQLVTILYRYAEAKGYDVSASADLSGYPDAGQVQTYAQPAMAWAVAEGIVEGMDGNLKPAGNASRAQIATILMRFCEDVAQ